jgi:beta-xylosidase
MQRRTWINTTGALALGALLALAGSPREAAAAPVTVLTPTRAVTWADYLGVNAHFLWFEPQVYAQQIAQLKALGLEWVRIDLHWDRHEPELQRYRIEMVDAMLQTVAAARLKPLVYLVGSAPFASSAPPGAAARDQYPPQDPRLFAERLHLLAQRYPQVAAWQVWNEPNLPAYWRPQEDPRAYGALLQASAAALRKAAPGKPVVMGGMAYYSQMPVKGGLMLEELGKLGAFSLEPVVAYHPYSEFPEGDDPRQQDFIARVNQLNPRLRGAGVKAIWATEWGWSSYAGPKEMQAIIGEAGQADYLLRRLAIMSTQDFDRVFLFALSDLDARATVRDRGYGLLTRSAQPKPSYLALQRFLRIMGPQVTPAAALNARVDASGLYSITWRSGSRTLWLFWGSTPTTASVTGIPGGTLHDPLSGQQQSISAQNGVLRVPVKTSLQILAVE